MKKHIPSFDEFLSESHIDIEKELNELKLTSAGVKELLSAIYYNWDILKSKFTGEFSFGSFKDILYFIRTGGQEEQRELENWVKSQGIEILKLT